MRARKYRDRIVIKQGKTSLETWANVRTLKGYKYQNIGLLEFKNPLIITIRKREGLEINEKTIIEYRGKTYIIQNHEFLNHDMDIEIFVVEYED